MDKRKKPQNYHKAVDETVKIPSKKGNGILRYTVNVDEKNNIARYSLAYINFNICKVDNGRVLGYDNCHGKHHKHLMGKEIDIKLTSYEKIAELFETEWRELHEKANEK